MSTPLPPHLDPRGRHRNSVGARRSGAPAHGSGLRVLTRLLSASLSLFLLVAAGYYWTTFRHITNNISHVGVSLNQGPATGSGTDSNARDENILLVGNDDRTDMTAAESRELHAAKDGGSMNTDTMMIVHIPANGSKATLISLPRDSYVHIAGFGENRLNAAYPDGYNSLPASASESAKKTAGANLLISTITNLTGVKINHYIQVDLIGFYRIAKAIGGVPVTLCNSVNDSHAANAAAGLTGGSGFVMSKGYHVLDGLQALEFVRQRHFLPLGDLDRIKRQQYFLTAAFRKMASAGILTKFRSLGDAIDSSITTDPGLNLLDLAQQMQNLSANNIIGKTIPTSNETIDGMDVLKVNPARVQAYVSKILNPVTAPTTSPSSSTSHAAGSTSSSPSSSASTSSAPKAIDSRCVD